jgi:hypothetical protein
MSWPSLRMAIVSEMFDPRQMKYRVLVVQAQGVYLSAVRQPSGGTDGGVGRRFFFPARDAGRGREVP